MRILCIIIILLTLSSPLYAEEWPKERWLKEVHYYYDGHGYEYDEFIMEIFSFPEGAIIEENGNFIGIAPITRIYEGYRPPEYSMTLTATPSQKGQYVQTKVFKGTVPLPKVVYFDMRLNGNYKEQ